MRVREREPESLIRRSDRRLRVKREREKRVKSTLAFSFIARERERETMKNDASLSFKLTGSLSVASSCE